jgi:hypothetical protein
MKLPPRRTDRSPAGDGGVRPRADDLKVLVEDGPVPGAREQSNGGNTRMCDSEDLTVRAITRHRTTPCENEPQTINEAASHHDPAPETWGRQSYYRARSTAKRAALLRSVTVPSSVP